MIHYVRYFEMCVIGTDSGHSSGDWQVGFKIVKYYLKSRPLLAPIYYYIKQHLCHSALHNLSMYIQVLLLVKRGANRNYVKYWGQAGPNKELLIAPHIALSPSQSRTFYIYETTKLH